MRTQTKTIPRHGSLSDRLAAQLRLVGVREPVREHRFHPTRRWRVDLMWLGARIAVECEGGTWRGGRHTLGAGYRRDVDKYNELALAGFLVLRVTSDMVRDGSAVALIERALRDNRHR